MKKFGVTVVKGMAGVGILILAFWGYQAQQSQGLNAQVSEQKARLRVPLNSGNAPAKEQPEPPDTGRWLAGDFHNHTYLTDGSNVPDHIFAHAFQFGLDWIANSEHDGAFSRNSEGSRGLPTPFSRVPRHQKRCGAGSRCGNNPFHWSQRPGRPGRTNSLSRTMNEMCRDMIMPVSPSLVWWGYQSSVFIDPSKPSAFSLKLFSLSP